MSDYVNYIFYREDGTNSVNKNAICFANLSYAKNRDYKYLVMDIKVAKENEEYKDRWLEVLQEIEPELEILEKNTKAKLPNLGNYHKNLLILTLLRDLKGHYPDVVSMSLKIMDNYPELDKLSAIMMASAYGRWNGGGGHSLCRRGADKLRTIEEYQQATFENHNLNEFSQTLNFDFIRGRSKYDEIRSKMKHSLDIGPIVEVFGVSKT